MKGWNGAAALIGVALVAAGVGFATGWTVRGGPQAVPDPPASAPAAALSHREPTLAPPEPVVSEAASEPPAAPEVESAPVPPRRPRSEAASEPAVAQRRAPPTAAEVAKRQEDLLVSAGFGSSSARDLREHFERLKGARRLLHDQAEQEEQAAALELARNLKREIGEEAYGYMLWSGGLPNRVVVKSVLDGSSASRAGLQPDDVVMRYDGERIFEMGELRFSVQQPSGSASAELEVLRNDQLLKVSVPRGILGVYIDPRFDPPREPDPRDEFRARARGTGQDARQPVAPTSP